MKKIFYVFVLFIMLAVACGSLGQTSAHADTSEVISFGADLSEEQKGDLANFFGVPNYKNDNIPVVEVTNAEEHTTLQGLVPKSAIGTRAISSSYVQILNPGSGIFVETRNITFVTKEIFANALSTAKVKDAKVIAAAPFPVSGTAALTGMFKSFEVATGQTLDPTAKDIANEELVKTGQIGEQIGDKNKAAQLIMQVKEQVVANNVTNPEQIRQIVINVGQDLNLNLTVQQIDQVINLMTKINQLDLNVQDISGQLSGVKDQLNTILANEQEVKSLLQRILDSIINFINQIKALLG